MPCNVALRTSVAVACSIAILCCATGARAQAVDPFNPGANQVVDTLAIQPDGKILVGGQFTGLGGGTGATVRSHIGRLNANGTVDTTFVSGANARVFAVAVQPDGKILVGGLFTTLGVGGGVMTRNRIGRLNADGSVDAGFNPGANHNVYALVLESNGNILVGGEFSGIGGGTGTTARSRLARLSPTGAVESFNPGVSKLAGAPIVYTLALQTDGKVVVGGYFNGLGGGTGTTTRNFIGRVDTNGVVDGFNPGANSISGVNALAIQVDGRILVGGTFTGLGNGTGTTLRSNIGRLNADGTVDLGFNPGAEAQVLTLGVQVDGKILLGGYFKWLGDAGGPSRAVRNYIGRLSSNGVVDGTFDPGANNVVNAIAIQGDGAILAGGLFGLVGGGSVTPPGGTTARQRIARFATTNPAIETLTLTGAGTIETWMRSGAGPEVSFVTFEFSFDGSFYSLLGNGTRIAGGWQLNSVNLPTTQTLFIRARGYYGTGYQNGSGSIVQSILFVGPAPAVVTGTPLVFFNAALLQGTADPNLSNTQAHFEYGLTTAYGGTTSPQVMGDGNNPVEIPGGTILELVCNTVYHFRATATNGNGRTNGSDVAFTTSPCPAPFVNTGVATTIGLTGATLTGNARPNGLATSAMFEYGPTTSYGSTTPQQALGAGYVAVSIGGGTVAGLTCDTVYHFRAVATNSSGTGFGDDTTFVTAPCSHGAFNGFVYGVVRQFQFNPPTNGNLIYAFGIDATTGALTRIAGFPVDSGGNGGGNTPEHVAYDAANGRLFVANDGSGTLSVFAVNRATGALTAMPFSPIVLGSGPGSWSTVRVHPSGSPVVVGDTYGVRIASFVITPTTATAAAGSPYPAGSVAPLSSAFSSDGLYVYLGGGSGSSFVGYSVNAGSGVLTPLAGSPFTTGTLYPQAFATDTSGRLFSGHWAAPQVRAFTTASGIPTEVTGSPFSSGALTYISHSVVHSSGFYIVADQVSGVGVYRIAGSGSNTTLTAVAGSPFVNDSVNAVALSGDGGLLIAAGRQDTRNLSVFRVNPSTGSLTSLLVQPPNSLGVSGAIIGLAIARSGSAFGDFDAGGKGDLLLRNKSTGQNIGWLMNGLTVSTSAFMPTIADTNWEIRGRGDFDGDSKADVIWRNKSSGQDIGWLMNGLTVATSAFMPTIADTNWEIRGVGDFDSDGKADVILRNKSTGQNIGWLMNGLTVSLAAFMPTIADTNWEIVGVGDFNGDGKADVILRNKSTGQNIGWLMNGLTVSLAAFLPTIADTNWEIKGVGDFNGDGKADVVLRNRSTGQNIGWLMDGLTVSLAAFLPTIADTNWEIKGAGDFDGDAKADIILRSKSSGQNIGWLMNGLAVSTSALMPTIADTNWEFVGQGQ